MPKRAKPDDTGKVIHMTANSDGAKLRDFLDRIQNLQSAIDTQMNEARRDCAPYRDDIKAVTREAAEAGFSKKEFKTHVTRERKERYLAHVADKLNDEQRLRYETMLHSLGSLADTPLGQAAIAEAEARLV